MRDEDYYNIVEMLLKKETLYPSFSREHYGGEDFEKWEGYEIGDVYVVRYEKKNRYEEFIGVVKDEDEFNRIVNEKIAEEIKCISKTIDQYRYAARTEYVEYIRKNEIKHESNDPFVEGYAVVLYKDWEPLNILGPFTWKGAHKAGKLMADVGYATFEGIVPLYYLSAKDSDILERQKYAELEVEKGTRLIVVKQDDRKYHLIAIRGEDKDRPTRWGLYTIDELRHNIRCCWTLEEGIEGEGLLHHGEHPDGDTDYRWVEWV